MPAGEVTRESVCPTLPSFLHGDGADHLPLTAPLTRCLGSGRCPPGWGRRLHPPSGLHSEPAPISAEPPQRAPCLRTREAGEREGHSLTLEGMRRSRRQRPGQDQNWAGPSSPAVTSCRLVSIQAFSRQVCLLTRKGRKGVTGDVGAGQELKK